MTKSLHILGSASQQPTRYRSHVANFLKWECHGSTAEGMIFDCGEGTQRQLIFSNISCADISRIFLTHGHGDHTLGLPGLIQGIVNATQDFEKTLEIYYPAAMQNFFDNLRYSCAYKTRKLNIVPVPIAEDGVIFENSIFKIIALSLKHRMPTFGYRVEEKEKRSMLPEKLSVVGIQGSKIRELCTNGKITFGDKEFFLDDFSVIKRGKIFSFVMDTSPCENAIKLAQNADLVVCESTYLSTEKEEALSHAHMTAQFAAEMAKSANAKKLVLTHFSQRYANIEDFEIEAQEVFKSSVAVRDGDVIPF